MSRHVDARRVHALMAAGLANPELLARWRREPALLSALGLSPGAMDLDRLWKFAGLSEKIRYNPCRNDLPLTFRLLSKLGLEIEVFASYAPRAAELRKAGKNSVEDKIQGLFEFLAGWAERDRPAHVMLCDMIRHETTVAAMRARAAGGDLGLPGRAPGEPAGKAAPGAVPVIAGALTLQRMAFDPRVLAERLRQQAPRLDDLEPGELRLGYWWNGDAPALHILELDELGFCLLSAVDGASSVAELAAPLARAGTALPLAPLLGAFADLAELGLIVLQPGSRVSA